MAASGADCYYVLRMWRATGASGRRPRLVSAPAARVPFLLLGALGLACGADANDLAQSSGALEAERDAPEASRAAAPAPRPSEPDVPAGSAPGGDPLVLPAAPPLTEPQQPAPLPSAELNTPRAINATEPLDVVVPPGECRFEYLGTWVRCENAGWPNTVATDAPDLLSCMQQCLERDDCTAVTDYLWLGVPDLGCYLYLSTCDAPAFEATWGEEDGGRDFRRVCS